MLINPADVAVMAQTVTTFLAPFLPALLKLGEEAEKEVVKKTVDAGWEEAQTVWHKIHPKMEAKPAALEAAQDVAAAPDDADAQAALRQQIKKILSEDELLAKEISEIVEQGQRAGVIVTASGERSVAIVGGVSSSTIITGDNHKSRPKQ